MAENQSTHTPHALYRFWDANDQLLYIGITLNPGARWKQHSKDKPWWSDVARITVEQYPDRLSVLNAERAAIITERPVHNVVHNRGLATTPARPLVDASDMPDDCHDHCGPDGYLGMYYPYTWRNGVGTYRCERGHTWTCTWGHTANGDDPIHAGRNHLPGRDVLTPRERSLVNAALRTPGHYGGVL